MTVTLDDAAMRSADGILDADAVQEYCHEQAKASLQKRGLTIDPDTIDENEEYWREYSISLDEVLQETRKKLLPHKPKS